MLDQLYIENIAVIEKASIDFSKGFNVLTGETGAGKSIVIDSIHAVLGHRTSKELIRSGAKSAFVSAVFRNLSASVLKRLSELSYLPEEDGSLLLQREIREDGRTVCRINERPATVSILRDIGSLLVDIHGQNENYGLLSQNQHLRYLDQMAQDEGALLEYQNAYNAMRSTEKQLKSLQMDEAEKARKIDLLSYQVEELENADLKPGEEKDLKEKRAFYRNSEKLANAVGEATGALSGGEESMGALSELETAAKALEEVQNLPQAQQLSSRLSDLSYELEDCLSELQNFSEQLSYEPEDVEKTEERLDQLYRLGQKYGPDEETMLSFLEKAKNELNQIQSADEVVAELNEKFEKQREKAQKLAKILSNLRRETAKTFVKRVREELNFLDMPNVEFEVEQLSAEMEMQGIDRVQFLISTNAGEPLKPISKIASGGELSRIMLAIKCVLADRDEIGTLIFDEVDTGVSGSAAQKVGLKLWETSRGRQVLCVTHLAQIAALGDQQYFISKRVDFGRTFTKVDLLNREGREKELARIMGGGELTPLLLQNASEMLSRGERKKLALTKQR
jgi:DNA repair protein RecN (Recombination protein N)